MHFDPNKTIGALGVLIAAKWYRSQHPQHLLVSLDTAEARRWMNLENDAKRADLLGLSVDNGQPTIDILEIKSGEDARNVYKVNPDGSIGGKPVEQLLNTGKSVAAIFGLNDGMHHILTPPRREVLRTHLFRQGLSGQRTPKEKQEWEKLLNAVFEREKKPQIRLHLVVVSLGINKEASSNVVRCNGDEIHLVHLNEHAVNMQLGAQVNADAISEAAKKRPAEGSTKADGEAASSKPKAKCVEERRNLAKEKGVAQRKPVREDGGEQVEVTCRKLRAACQDFGIQVSEIDPANVEVGPSVLRYKIRLAPGEQGEKLRKQAENIARQLAAKSVPIVEFLRGTEYMYLDLPRSDRQVVMLEPRLSETQLGSINELPLHIGVDPAGDHYRLDLGDDRLPHLLIAGGTGSGKTIFLYSVVLSLATSHSAATLELGIIDPKQTDFTVFGELPHLRNGRIVTDPKEGVDLLRDVADHELQTRSDALQAARSRDIKAYNLLHPKKPIRPLVMVIDEYADLVMVLPKREREEFDRVVSRLAARGRNVGIHLVVATQRPTVDVITGNIKANMPCRVSFSLPSGRDSQVILDEPGAERLLRNGDMLLLLEGRLTRLQGYYVEPTRIDFLINKTGTRT